MLYKISTEYDGKPRKVFAKLCKECNAEFWVPKHVLKRRTHCSTNCFNKSKATSVEMTCDWCENIFKSRPSASNNSKSGYRFCSRKCKDVAQQTEGIKEIHPSHYNNGIRKYRDRAFRKYGKICKVCKYSKDERMLDVDHINNNRKDASIDNLQVLCVWCHALKTRGISSTGEQLLCKQKVTSSNLVFSTI